MNDQLFCGLALHIYACKKMADPFIAQYFAIENIYRQIYCGRSANAFK